MPRPSFVFSSSSRGGLLHLFLLTLAATTTTFVSALRFDASQVDYNLNRNRTATNPLDYWGSRQDDEPDFKYAESPTNWRMPFYTIFLDRFVNGNPANDDINGTMYESDFMSTQLRFGGDLAGLKDSLDYIQGMGVKVGRRLGWGCVLCKGMMLTWQAVYIAGSPFINLPWGADSYSVGFDISEYELSRAVLY